MGSSNAKSGIGGQVNLANEAGLPNAFKSMLFIAPAGALKVAQKCGHGLKGIFACTHQGVSEIEGQLGGYLFQEYDKCGYPPLNKAQC